MNRATEPMGSRPMSDFNEEPTSRRAASKSSLGNLAALSVAAFLLSVLAAKTLSHMVDDGALSAIAFGRPDNEMRRLAGAAPAAGLPQRFTIVRSVGVDGQTTTATIPGPIAAEPTPGAQPLSPCGKSDQ